jgi:hypothetical protein
MPFMSGLLQSRSHTPGFTEQFQNQTLGIRFRNSITSRGERSRCAPYVGKQADGAAAAMAQTLELCAEQHGLRRGIDPDHQHHEGASGPVRGFEALLAEVVEADPELAGLDVLELNHHAECGCISVAIPSMLMNTPCVGWLEPASIASMLLRRHHQAARALVRQHPRSGVGAKYQASDRDADRDEKSDGNTE